MRLLFLAVLAALLVAAPAQAGILKGKIQTTWTLSHANNDDPIVFPGQSGAAHHHCFMGNTTTNAASTTGSLLNGGTTAALRDNKSAYWVPALIFPNGSTLCPNSAQAYYGAFSKNTAAIAGGAIQPPTTGLAFLTGNQQSTAPQHGITSWVCAGDNLTYTLPPATCASGRVSTIFRSPSCWDGTRLRSPGGREHMAYPAPFAGGGYGCPASHPVAVPQLEMSFNFPQMTQAQYASFRLVSDKPGAGRGTSQHMDTFWAWGAEGPEFTKCLNDPRQTNSTICDVISAASGDQKIFDASRSIASWARPIAAASFARSTVSVLRARVKHYKRVLKKTRMVCRLKRI